MAWRDDPHPSGFSSYVFTDHEGSSAVSACYGRSTSPGKRILTPLWSVQIYVTFGATVSSHPELPSQWLAAARSRMTELYPIRFDIYFQPQASTDACMAHCRAEKAARANTALDIVPSYYHESYPNFLVIVDQEIWENSKVQTLMFDPLPECKNDENSDIYVPHDTLIREAKLGVITRQWPRSTDTLDMNITLRDIIYELTAVDEFDVRRDQYEKAIEAGKENWSS